MYIFFPLAVIPIIPGLFIDICKIIIKHGVVGNTPTDVAETFVTLDISELPAAVLIENISTEPEDGKYIDVILLLSVTEDPPR